MSLFFIGEAATVSSDGLKIEFDGAAITSPDTHRTHQTALSDGDLIDGNGYVWTVIRDSDGRAERVTGTYNDDTTDYIGSWTATEDNGVGSAIGANDVVTVKLMGEADWQYVDTTVDTGNVTAAAGEFHRLTVSGMTADRDFILPTCSVGDAQIGFQLVTDAPASYELVLKGDTGVTVILKGNEVTAAEVTRYLIDNESAVFQAVATNTWLCTHDGRIPVNARITGDGVTDQTTGESAGVYTENGNMQTTEYNRGCAITTGSRTTPSYSKIALPRPGEYIITMGWMHANAVTGYVEAQVREITNNKTVCAFKHGDANGTSVYDTVSTTYFVSSAGVEIGVRFRSGAGNAGVARWATAFLAVSEKL